MSPLKEEGVIASEPNEAGYRSFSLGAFRFSRDGAPRDGLPTIAFQDDFLSAEGLNSLIESGVASLEESYQRAATYVDKILRAYGDDGANASSWRSGGAGLTR